MKTSEFEALQDRLLWVTMELETAAAKEYEANWLTPGQRVLRDPHSGKFAKKGTVEYTSRTDEELHPTTATPALPSDPIGPAMLEQLATQFGKLDGERQTFVRDFLQDEDLGRVTANTLRALGLSEAQIAQAARFVAPGIKAGETLEAYFKRFMAAEVDFVQGLLARTAKDKPELAAKLAQFASVMVPIATMVVLTVGPELALGALAGQSLGAILTNTAVVQGSLFAANKGLDLAGVHNPYIKGAVNLWVGAKTGGLLLQKDPTLIHPGDFADANVEQMLAKARNQAEQTTAITEAIQKQIVNTGETLTRTQANARDAFIDSLSATAATTTNPGLKDFLDSAAAVAAVAKSKAVVVADRLSPEAGAALADVPVAKAAQSAARSLISTNNLRRWVRKEIRSLGSASPLGKELQAIGVDPKLVASRLAEMSEVDRLALTARTRRVRDVDRLVQRIKEIPQAREQWAAGAEMMQKAAAAEQELAELKAALPSLAKRYPLGTQEAWQLAEKIRTLEIKATQFGQAGEELQAELGFRQDILSSEVFHGRQLDRFLYESPTAREKALNYEAFLANIRQHNKPNVVVETTSKDEASAIAMAYAAPTADTIAQEAVESYEQRLQKVVAAVEEFSKYTNANRPIKVASFAGRGFQSDPIQLGLKDIPTYLDAGASASTSVTWHEAGHAAAMGSNSLDREIAFRNSRRESPTDIPLKNHPGEYAIDDSFTNPYTGKRYPSEGSPGRDTATEITSMAAEALSHGAALHKTGLSDREHLMFALGTLRRPLAANPPSRGGSVAFSELSNDMIREAVKHAVDPSLESAPELTKALEKGLKRARDEDIAPSVTTSTRHEPVVVDSADLQELRKLKQRYINESNMARANEVETVIQAREAAIQKNLAEGTKGFFDGFTEQNLGPAWEKLLHEQFPIRPNNDATWIADEANTVAEFQSQMLQRTNLYLETSDATEIIKGIKATRRRKGKVDWGDVQDLTASYYQMARDRAPQVVDVASYPEGGTQLPLFTPEPSAATTPAAALTKDEIERQLRNLPESTFANYVLSEFGVALSGSEAKIIAGELTRKGIRLKPSSAETTTTFLRKPVYIAPTQPEIKAALAPHKADLAKTIESYFRLNGRWVPKSIRESESLTAEQNAPPTTPRPRVENKWTTDTWLQVLENNRELAVRKFEQENQVSLYDLFDPEVAKSSGHQELSNRSLATFMANYKKIAEKEKIQDYKHIIVAPGEESDGRWHVPEMKAIMPGDYEPLDDYISRNFNQGDQVLVLLNNDDLASGQGMRVTVSEPTLADQQRVQKQQEEWTLEPTTVGDTQKIPTKPPDKPAIYQEEAGSTFTHDGQKYDLNEALKIVSRKPIEQIKVADLEWVAPYTEVDPARQQAADLNAPLLVTRWEGKLVPVDGAHRLAKAIAEKKTVLPARIITPEELEQTLISPSASTPTLKAPPQRPKTPAAVGEEPAPRPSSTGTKSEPSKPAVAGFQRNIKKMFNDDQSLRRTLERRPADVGLHYKLDDLQTRHTAALQGYMKKYGWPTRQQVGEDAAYQAAVLVQHSDDLAFQKEALAEMKRLMKQPGQINKAQLAELEDRIRLAEDEPQVYGTQVTWNPKTQEFEPDGPVANPDQLDERRKALGLPSMEDYLETFVPPAQE